MAERGRQQKESQVADASWSRAAECSWHGVVFGIVRRNCSTAVVSWAHLVQGGEELSRQRSSDGWTYWDQTRV